MQSITSQQPFSFPKKCTIANSTSTTSSSSSPLQPPGNAKESNKPEWMKRLQEKNKKAAAKQERRRDYNRHGYLFPTFEECKAEITYLEGEDDLAASYFPLAKKPSTRTLDLDLPPVSGYNFEEIILGR